MKIFIPIILTLIQFSKANTQEANDILTLNTSITKEGVEWEQPFNFFAAASASYMFVEHYSETISSSLMSGSISSNVFQTGILPII